MRAKVAGAQWEALFESAAWRFGCKVIKIPSGCRWVGKNKIQPVTTPFDFCLIRKSVSVYLDTKTTLAGTFIYSDIDQQQVYWLSQCAAGGCKAGYVVEFRKLKRVVFFSVEQLAGLKPRSGLYPDDGVQLSGDDDRLDLGALFYERTKETATAGTLAPSK